MGNKALKYKFIKNVTNLRPLHETSEATGQSLPEHTPCPVLGALSTLGSTTLSPETRFISGLIIVIFNSICYLSGVLFADDMHEVASGPERGDGGEVGRAGVHDAAAEHADPAALTLVQAGVQRGDQPAHFCCTELGRATAGAVVLVVAPLLLLFMALVRQVLGGRGEQLSLEDMMSDTRLFLAEEEWQSSLLSIGGNVDTFCTANLALIFVTDTLSQMLSILFLF